MKPTVALVGRPNVGKSTLFNRLTKTRMALVADEPGLTRDRQYGDGVVGDRPYSVIDTGGLMEGLRAREPAAMTGLVLEQTRRALTEADAVVLVVDYREGATALDAEIAAELRRLGKPVVVAVNKAEGVDPAIASAEFHRFGMAPYAISAAHGDGIDALMQAALARLPVIAPMATAAGVARIAIVGRPNVGKSTLLNAVLGDERVIVGAEPGTTRDSIHVPFEHRGKPFVLIDTAGIRRRGRVHQAVEKYSVVKSLQAIDESDVVILVIDGKEGVTEQDATLAGYIVERGRAVVVAINKWDVLDADERAQVRGALERRLVFLSFAEVFSISARTGLGVGRLFPALVRAHRAAHREVATSKLNQILRRAIAATPPPVVRGRRIRPKYAHQGGRNPPVIVVHGTQVKSLPAAYQRYLANVYREALDLTGTPVRIELRNTENPYVRDAKSARK